MYEEQEFFIEKMRGELCVCWQRWDLIGKQQEVVVVEIVIEGEVGNMVIVGCFQVVFRCLFVELENERDLQLRIEVVLKESENVMWYIEIQEG